METNHLFIINFLIFLLFFIGRWVQGNWKKDGKLIYGIQEIQYVLILGLMIYAQSIDLFDLESLFAWQNISIVISVLPLKWAGSNIGYGMGYSKQWWYLGNVNFFDGLLKSIIGKGKYKTLWLGIIYFLLIGLGLVSW